MTPGQQFVALEEYIAHEQATNGSYPASITVEAHVYDNLTSFVPNVNDSGQMVWRDVALVRTVGAAVFGDTDGNVATAVE